MLGTAKETHHQSPRVLLPAGTLLFPHQPRHALDYRSLAGTAHHCYSCLRHHHSLPHLETQA